MAKGKSALPTESGAGPNLEPIGCENAHSNGVSSGPICVETDVTHDDTAEPVESEDPTD